MSAAAAHSVLARTDGHRDSVLKRNQVETEMPYRTLCVLSLAIVFSAAPAVRADDSLVEHQRWVTSICFSGDGAKLLTGGGQSLLYRPGDVLIWNVADGKQVAKLEGHSACVWAVDATADATTAVSAAYDGEVIVWDVVKAAPRHKIEHAGWVRCLAIAPDGKHFAFGGEDGKVALHKLDSGEQVRVIEAHGSTVMDLAFSPDGAQLATASTDKTAKVFNVADGKEIAKLEGHEDAVWAVAFSPKNDGLATAGADRKVRLWSPDWKQTGTLEGHRDWVSDLAYSADGEKLISVDHGRAIRIWNLADKKVIKDVSGKSSVWAVAVAGNGKVAVGSHKDSIRLWDLASGQELLRNPEDHAGPTPPPPPKPEPPKEEEKKEDGAKKDDAEKKDAEKEAAEKKEDGKKDGEK